MLQFEIESIRRVFKSKYGLQSALQASLLNRDTLLINECIGLLSRFTGLRIDFIKDNIQTITTL